MRCTASSGVQEPKAVLASPVAGSVADKAGLRGLDTVMQASLDGDELQTVRSFEDLRWRLTQGALDGRDLTLMLATKAGDSGRRVATLAVVLGLRDNPTGVLRGADLQRDFPDTERGGHVGGIGDV